MLYFFSGTDTTKARAAMHAKIAALGAGLSIVRITDAHTAADIEGALRGGGMFAVPRVVVFEGIFLHPELRGILSDALAQLRASSEHMVIFEEKPDAATRKLLEKYAHTSERHDKAALAQRDSSIFTLANALRRRDKKALWVGYQAELLKGTAAEAIHGVLFWAVKDILLKTRDQKEISFAKRLVATLVELPHEARRSGVELEYALEQFVLSIA